ncbi:hypothetical protein KBD20_02105 [Candidatus Saccharibacteria bacterium]|nr:hypothetical protein [Candidatus Saccharibacteria bacterium]
MSELVALVPFSSDDPSRIAIWDWLRVWWEKRLGIPIFVGEHNGELFNISLARNRAAEKAGDWQMAIILDADTFVMPEQIVKGVVLAKQTGALVFPFTQRWELTLEGTEMLLRDEESDWQSNARRHRWTSNSGCAIVTRELWDLVHGYDPGFVGWGHEDGAFSLMCQKLSDTPIERIEGKLWHMEHNPQESKKRNSPIYMANEQRWLKYAKAAKQEDAIDQLNKLRAETLKMH